MIITARCQCAQCIQHDRRATLNEQAKEHEVFRRICSDCLRPYGQHFGDYCPSLKTTFVVVTCDMMTWAAWSEVFSARLTSGEAAMSNKACVILAVVTASVTGMLCSIWRAHDTLLGATIGWNAAMTLYWIIKAALPTSGVHDDH